MFRKVSHESFTLAAMKSERAFIWWGLFLVISIIHVVARFGDWEMLAMGTKIALMPALMLVTLCYGPFRGRKTLLFALLLSWFGDVLLLFDQDHAGFFIGGLLSFLTAHVAYIILFSPRLPARRWYWVLLIPVLIYLGLFLSVLLPHTGALTIPVIVYATIIAGMMGAAILRLGKTSAAGFTWVAIGALFFVASDSILAHNKFVTEISGAGGWIMLTYLFAQAAIVVGIVKSVKA